MDAETIRAMKAGPELDRRIAETFDFALEPPCPRYHRVDDAEHDRELGWSGWCYTCAKAISEVEPVARRYSTDLTAAESVMDALSAWKCRVERCEETPGRVAYAAVVIMRHPTHRTKWNRGVEATADTAPPAICKAALLAVEAGGGG